MDLKLLSISNRNKFIEENKNFVYSVAQHICRRKLDWTNDDELSISLIAFNTACDTFESEKGNFNSYAGVVIRNTLFDYFRKAKNTPVLAFEEDETKFNSIDSKLSLNDFEKAIENKNRAIEIGLFGEELADYKLSFDILIESSPSHNDTRNSILNLAFLCTKEPSILLYIKEKKLLPVKEITLLANVNRKYVEKWRRYILTLILILSNDQYPYIKSYLNIKVGVPID